jgi:DNA-binding transcriptional ArsR family regulator
VDAPRPDPPFPFPDPIPSVIDFGTVNILAGAPGVGKTTLFGEWCARFRDGRSICGHQTHRPTALYYLSTDRGGHSTNKILNMHQLLDGTWTTYYNPLDDPTFDRKLMMNPTQALATLRWCLTQFSRAIIPGAHLVIDPAAPLFVPGSQNDPRCVAALLWELHVLAREYLVTVFVLAHFSKQLADASQRYLRPQDRISGSGAWSGFSDTQMFMVDPEPPQHPYHQVGWNPRHAAPETFKLLREGSYFVPYRSLEDVGVGKTRVPQTAYKIFVVIPEEGIKTSDLEVIVDGMLGISQATLYRHLKKLENLGVIERDHGFVKRVAIEQVVMVPDGESEDKPN